MPLSVEKAIRLWNRKLHYYLGLYFLFFIWLFAFTGLLLNHGSWQFAQFWPNREVTTYERAIEPPPAGERDARAQRLIRQLGLRGEVQWGTATGDRLEFQVNRPGQNFAVKADLARRTAKVERTDLNAWGVMHVLHTFTGARTTDRNNRRDWVLTTVWALSMDAVAVGLIAMVLSGIYMWWGLAGKRLFGLAALALGMAVCGWFLFGLRWFS